MPIRRVFFFQMAVDGRECHGATLMDRLEAPDGKLSDDKASSQVDNWPTSCQSSSLLEEKQTATKSHDAKKKTKQSNTGDRSIFQAEKRKVLLPQEK